MKQKPHYNGCCPFDEHDHYHPCYPTFLLASAFPDLPPWWLSLVRLPPWPRGARGDRGHRDGDHAVVEACVAVVVAAHGVVVVAPAAVVGSFEPWERHHQY